ncbi:MAG: pantoate--beta-alanine ligase [Verrucomicrobiota bacterium]
MIELQKIEQVQDWIQQEIRAGIERVLVPTMGGLHEGHLSLIDIARQRAGESGRVVVSLFVNPTQFGPDEDLQAYPKTMQRDRELCKERGVDLLFAPAVNEMYAEDASVKVAEEILSAGLCGQSRPVHFGGVCTIVTKLFNLFQPHAAVFGEKDFQQLAIIRRLVRDLNYPVDIMGGAIVREADGVAMSTRNKNLSPSARQQAVVLNKALFAAKGYLDEGGRCLSEIRALMEDVISGFPLARLDYLEMVDPGTLQALDQAGERLLIALAVYFDNTRLIDNLHWREEG